MIPYFHCLWKYGLTLGLWMQHVVEILVRWSIRPSICKRVIVCFTMVQFMAQTILVNFSPSSMPWPFAGIKACTIKPSTPILTTPFSGFRSVSVRPHWSEIPRQSPFSKSSLVLKTGSKPTTIAIPSSNGKPRNGAKFLQILAGSNKYHG